MRVKVLFFAAARDLAGASETVLELDVGATIADAVIALATAHARLGPHLGRMRVARNEAFADSTEGLADGDVLALIPPVAGG